MTATLSYYLIAGLCTLSSALIWVVNTLFLFDAGLDILGVSLANATFNVGMVVLEVPTGVFADTTGRRGRVVRGSGNPGDLWRRRQDALRGRVALERGTERPRPGGC